MDLTHALRHDDTMTRQILPYATRFAQNMGNKWFFLKDFTLVPQTSYFNGYSFGRELEKVS